MNLAMAHALMRGCSRRRYLNMSERSGLTTRSRRTRKSGARRSTRTLEGSVAEADVSMDYRLTGSGWSACTLEMYGQKCVTTASYLSDALRELVEGANHMLSGGHEARFRFDEEPGEYRWILRSVQDGGVSVRILEFPELWAEKP